MTAIAAAVVRLDEATTPDRVIRTRHGPSILIYRQPPQGPAPEERSVADRLPVVVNGVELTGPQADAYWAWVDSLGGDSR